MEFSFYILLFLTSVSLLIVVYNLFTAPILKLPEQEISFSPYISILIPARNEEENISDCLDSCLNQNYRNFEILTLDDSSSDRTNKIIKEYQKHFPKIKLIEGELLPSGWTGKNWACHQLAIKANGEYFLFIDADVRLKPDTLESALSLINKFEIKMLSIFPTQVTKNFGEKIIVPLMNWLLLSFLPLRKVYSSSNKSFIAANGQFILVNRKTYFEIGGHKKFRSKVVEDMEIAREVKAKGNTIITALGGDLVFCKMYNNFNLALSGFAKNFFSGFNISAFLFLALIIFLLVVFLAPFILFFFNLTFIVIIILILISRIIISILSRQSILENLLLHPFQMLIMFYAGIISVLNTKRRKNMWKGRTV